ncbi:uncharacterized protein LOC111986186 [Quercus suber]|uniref:uncharacterized protein LOC111986186 n=1 Tax=Quercus suber TaxID=58331 RepID=UPI000CE1E325|nr:uncharacterized protein LOC111986186 [Quercus suber]
MACSEKARLVDQEHDMARIQLKDKKLEIARMKEENEMGKLRMEKLKEEKELMMMDVNKEHVSPRLSLTNAAALNYLLQSEIFVSEDRQLWSVPLILGFEPKSTDFQPVGNAIRQGDYRINHIDVARKDFLAPFKFEGEASGEVQVLNAEEETDRQSSVLPDRIDVLDDSSEEDMVNLRNLMKNRNTKAGPKETGTSRPVVSLPSPPPQVPSDVGSKQLPDPKKKRPLTDNEEREVAPPKGTKQQKMVKDHRSKRGSSIESRDDSLIGDLTQQVYVAEEWNKKAYVEAQVEAHSRYEAEKSLGSLKEDYARLSEQLKEMTNQRNSLDAGLKTTKKQAEEQRKQLNMTEINLATKKELVKGLQAELQKAKETARLAEKDAQLAKEVVKTERKAAYKLGVEETQVSLTEQFAMVCREYYDITWGKALDAAGISVESDLRQPGSTYYDPNIRELPGSDSSPPIQPQEASEQSLISQVPHIIPEASKESD